MADLNFQSFIFYAFSAVVIGASVGVITSRNPVHSALLLVLAFFTSAGLWIQLQAEFLAIALVLVYVGAVMVLFLFVVMMLDVNLEKLRKDFWSYLPVGGLVAALLVLEMGWILWSHYSADGFQRVEPAQLAPDDSNTKQLGRLIYTVYVYPFEIAAVILLVAIVAAIALTLRHRKESKYIDPARQIEVRRKDRVRVVTMSSEKKQD
jgi:NADH-quinone oxidoreductase subunit J